MAPTHVMGGVAAWLAGCAVVGTRPAETGAGLAAAAVGALAPDVDHARAEAAQFCRFAGGLTAAAGVIGVLGHAPHHRAWEIAAGAGLLTALLPWLTRPRRGGYRGIVHSQWGILACAAASFVPVALGVPLWAGLALMAGWLSHLALDALTREGLRLMWPSQVRYGWFSKDVSMRTGGRKPGQGGKGKLGMEYVIVQPALAIVIGLSCWLALIGGSL